MRNACRRVCFVTDLEGDIAFFSKFVHQSEVLKFSPTGNLAWRRENANDVFVHGGDLFDRGPGDIRLSRLLCRFHDDFPERVFLLLGNRDLNKIRFSSELNLDVPPDRAFSAWWDPNAPTYTQYLEGSKLTDSVSLFWAIRYAWRSSQVLNRLKWALKHTLGCPNTFEYRREELALLEENREITDDQVVDSFVKSVNEEGCYFEYLKRGKLAVRLDKVNAHQIHCLSQSLIKKDVVCAWRCRASRSWVCSWFEHSFCREQKGRCRSSDFFWLVWVFNLRADVRGIELESLDEWIEKLNEFKENAFLDWRKRWSKRKENVCWLTLL